MIDSIFEQAPSTPSGTVKGAKPSSAKPATPKTQPGVKMAKKMAGQAMSKTAKIRKQAEKNPEFQKLQQDIVNAPLIPKDKMKDFVKGMTVLNNPKAMGGLYKRTGQIKNKQERVNLVNTLVPGLQAWTQQLGNASAALTIKSGDEAKAKLKNMNSVNEQAAPQAATTAAMKTINKAQKRAFDYLKMNQITGKDVKNVATGQPTKPTADQAKGIKNEQLFRKALKRRIEEMLANRAPLTRRERRLRERRNRK